MPTLSPPLLSTLESRGGNQGPSQQLHLVRLEQLYCRVRVVRGEWKETPLRSFQWMISPSSSQNHPRKRPSWSPQYLSSSSKGGCNPLWWIYVKLIWLGLLLWHPVTEGGVVKKKEQSGKGHHILLSFWDSEQRWSLWTHVNFLFPVRIRH